MTDAVFKVTMCQRVQPISFDRGQDALGRDLWLHHGGDPMLELRPQQFHLFSRHVRRQQLVSQHIIICLSQGDQALGQRRAHEARTGYGHPNRQPMPCSSARNVSEIATTACLLAP